MLENKDYDRRAEQLSRAELEAIQTLKANGWVAMSSVWVEDGRPELGDGSATYRHRGRKPIALIKDAASFAADAADQSAVADPDQETKRRGRPKKQ